MHIHAHLITAASIEDALLSDELKIPSVDTHHVTAENFGIEDARTLTNIANKKPMSGAYRSFVICAAAMTREAQNALLKLLEEPPQSSVFYIVVPHASLLLPTLRSRLIETAEATNSFKSDHVVQFLQKSLADRLADITRMQKQKDTNGMQRLVQEIGEYVRHHTAQFPKEALQVVLFVESHIRVKGGSKKMLLEHLALSLPVM